MEKIGHFYKYINNEFEKNSEFFSSIYVNIKNDSDFKKKNVISLK